MLNIDKWRAYMSWCASPDCYINFGFYCLIGAALQRRVWVGPAHKKLYGNNYTILTGEASLGKGLVLTTVNEILRYHKWRNPREFRGLSAGKSEDELKKTLEDLLAYDEASARESLDVNGNAGKHMTELADKPLLFPVGADAITYQALLVALPKALRRKDITVNGKSVIYTHCSMTFCLEELSSLFRKQTEDVVNFLVKVYDCNDYEYETISRKKDRVQNPCVSILAGTTPEFLREIFSDQLINQGWSSRCWFIFARENRFKFWKIPELDNEQCAYKYQILHHLKLLAELHGPVTYTLEAEKVMDEWLLEKIKPNTSVKLIPYYGRKNIHLQKLAMAIHFGESTEMVMGPEPFIKAREILAEEEKKMHLCLGLEKNNPVAVLGEKIIRYINHHYRWFNFRELYAEFAESCPAGEPREQLTIALDHLLFAGRLLSKMQLNARTQRQEMYYGITND